MAKRTKVEQKMDREVTDSIVDAFGAVKAAFVGFTRLCESGAEYLDAKNRERFDPHNLLLKKVAMRKEKWSKTRPPKKV